MFIVGQFSTLMYSMLQKNKVLLCMQKSLCGIALGISVHLIRLAVRKNPFGSLREGEISN